MAWSDNVVFIFYGRFKQRDVCFPWQGQTTWYLLSMVRSKMIFILFIPGWCLLITARLDNMMFTFHDRVPHRDVYFNDRVPHRDLYFQWQGPTPWSLLSMTGSYTVMFTFHNRVPHRDVYFPWQGPTTWYLLSMTGSYTVMFTFNDKVPHRDVYFTWHGHITWCSFFIAGSINVLFTFPWQGQSAWCLLFHDRVNQRDVYFSMTRSNNVMFTFHGRVSQRDVYFPWQGPTTWLTTPWRERVTQSASSLLTTRASEPRSTSWESDLPSWARRKWRWTSRNTATWTLGGTAGLEV